MKGGGPHSRPWSFLTDHLKVNKVAEAECFEEKNLSNPVQIKQFKSLVLPVKKKEKERSLPHTALEVFPNEEVVQAKSPWYYCLRDREL